MTYSSEVLADSPLIYYRLGESSGTVAVDSSGNGNDGTYGGAVTLGVPGLIAGDANTAVHFDGTSDDQYVKSDLDLGNTIYSAFTLECILTIDAGAVTVGLPIGILDSTYSYWMEIYQSGYSGTYASIAADYINGFCSPTNIPPETRVHLALTYDGTVLNFYRDSELVRQDTGAAGLDADFTGVSAFLYVGGTDLGFNNGVTGVIDEVAFYTSALSAERITAHVAVMAPTETYETEVMADGPDVYLRLNETSGTTAVDSSGNGNDWTYSVDASLMTTTSLIPNDADAGILIDNPTHTVASPVNPSWLNAGAGLSQYTMEMIVNISDSGPGSQLYGSVVGRPNFDTPDGSGNLNFITDSLFVGGAILLSLGTTYHLCATYDGTLVSLYINGSILNAQLQSGLDGVFDPQYFEIGYSVGNTATFVADEVTFYSTALTPERVFTHYIASLGLAAPEEEEEEEEDEPPVITSISPSFGTTSGGTVVTINGTGFSGATAIQFGATSGPSFSVLSDVAILVSAPAHALGAVDVTVTAGLTSSVTVADQFTYIASISSITSVSPNSGPTGGGTEVTITGIRFTGATAVKFGTSSATSFTVNSDTEIVATSPAHAGGINDISVTTPSGTSGPTTSDRFTFTATPFITSVSPSTDSVSGGTTITLTGTQFTGATTVLFGTTSVAFTVNSDISITVVAPAHISQTVNIRVTNVSGTSPTATGNQFTFVGVGGPVVVVAPVVRWVFFDPSDGSTGTFEINPDSGGTPSNNRDIVDQNRVAPNELVNVWATADNPQTLNFTGTILTETMYNFMVTWFNKVNPIELTDDLGRVFTIMFTKFDAQREYRPTSFWFHTYDATCMVVSTS